MPASRGSRRKGYVKSAWRRKPEISEGKQLYLARSSLPLSVHNSKIGADIIKNEYVTFFSPAPASSPLASRPRSLAASESLSTSYVRSGDFSQGREVVLPPSNIPGF